LRNRTLLIVSIVLAGILWAGILAFMNQFPPTSLNQALFLALWGLAMLTTCVPLSYLANARWGRPMGPKGDLSRALRQGTMASVVAIVLLALRFMRMLGPLMAAILVAIVVVAEVLINLRRR
jgi:hypothetical protein